MSECGKAAPRYYGVPVSMRLYFSVLQPERFCGCNHQFGHGCAILQRFEFRFFTGITHKDYLVDSSHKLSFLNFYSMENTVLSFGRQRASPIWVTVNNGQHTSTPKWQK
jgi:hypothetical protein